MKVLCFAVSIILCSFGPCAASDLDANYRKDIYLPTSSYNEPTPEPTTGGRVSIVGLAAASGTVDGFKIDGSTVTLTDDKDWTVDFYHVWPKTVKAGQPVWVVFHSRKDKWDTVKSANITLLAGSTVLLDGGFKVYQPPVVLSYVTTTSDYKSAVVHVQNTQSSSATVASIVFNGQTFNASECGSPNVVPPNQNNVWVVPLSSPLSSGTLWTVVITYTGGIPPTVGGGRVIKPHFPVEHWPKSTDCPYPGINDKNYKFLKDTTSFDTWFLYDTKKCSTTQEDIANNLAAKNGFYVFFDNDVDTSKVTDTSMVLAILADDECDKDIETHIRPALSDVQKHWDAAPDIPVYIGGSRNRYAGAFASVADVKGMDFYIAACAPHVTQWGQTPPVRSSYDYLRTNVVNQAPSPAWGYGQGFDDAWNSWTGTHRQPDQRELEVQHRSVIAAGGKGVMIFESEISENAGMYKDSWTKLAALNKETLAIGEYLRTGSMVTDSMVSKDDDDSESVCEAIYSPEALILVCFTTKTDGGYNDLLCGGGDNCHWKFNDHTINTVSITLPLGFTVQDQFEIHDGSISSSSAKVESGTITLSGGAVKFSDSTASRIFVFAKDGSVRTAVQAVLG